MKILFVQLLVAVGLFSGAQAPVKWAKFESSTGLFSILLPGQPREEKETKSGPHGSYTTHIFTSSLDDEMYIAGWLDYHRKVVFDSQKELELNRDNFVKGVNGRLRTSVDIALKDYPGIEFVGTFQSRSFKSRVFIVSKRSYMLLAICPTAKDCSQNISRFFASFEVKPAPSNSSSGS